MYQILFAHFGPHFRLTNERPFIIIFLQRSKPFYYISTANNDQFSFRVFLINTILSIPLLKFLQQSQHMLFKPAKNVFKSDNAFSRIMLPYSTLWILDEEIFSSSRTKYFTAAESISSLNIFAPFSFFQQTFHISDCNPATLLPTIFTVSLMDVPFFTNSARMLSYYVRCNGETMVHIIQTEYKQPKLLHKFF